MKKTLKTYEEYIGDIKNKYAKSKDNKEETVSSIDTNEPGKHYDQEDDGSDQTSRSLLNKY